MAKLGFHIDKSKKDKDNKFPIRARIYVESKAANKTLPYKVKSRHWNKTKQRVSPPGSSEKDNGHIEINEYLDLLSNRANEFFTDCRKKNISVTLQLAKKNLDEDFISSGLKDIGFFEAFDEFIKVGQSIKATNTTKTVNTVKNILKEFQDKQEVKISFDNITVQFFDSFKEYGYCIREKQVSDGYMDRIKRVLNTFLNWATDRGYYNGREHLKFKTPINDNTIITLTPDEFKSLYYFEFDNPKLQRVAEIFCFGCLTGLRFSDLMKLKPEHIQGNYIYLTIQKTKSPVEIAILEKARTIINLYENPVRILPKISNQKLNDYIKICCEKAGIDQDISITFFHGNKREEVSKPKYKWITAHVARKTFVTLSFYLDMDVKTIKAITGHTQDRTFDKYLKIAKEQIKGSMEKAWGKL